MFAFHTQQNGGNPGDMNPSDNPGGPASDPENLKLIQKQLAWLVHAQECQRREREQSTSSDYQMCTLPYCRTMKDVLNHMMECQAERSCTCEYVCMWKNRAMTMSKHQSYDQE